MHDTTSKSANCHLCDIKLNTSLIHQHLCSRVDNLTSGHIYFTVELDSTHQLYYVTEQSDHSLQDACCCTDSWFCTSVIKWIGEKQWKHRSTSKAISRPHWRMNTANFIELYETPHSGAVSDATNTQYRKSTDLLSVKQLKKAKTVESGYCR